MRNTRIIISMCALLLLAFPRQSSGVDSTGWIEYLFGATNVSGIVGNGALAAGISKQGDLTVLSWPSPGFSDQLLYLTSNDINARERPRLGAMEGMGMYGGMILKKPDGSELLTWFRGNSWRSDQHYLSGDTAVLLTRFTNETLGVTVTQTDFVAPSDDLLVRRYTFELSEELAGSTVHLAAFANPGPTLCQIEQIPICDFVLDEINDYIAVYDEDLEGIVHFQPMADWIPVHFNQLINIDDLYFKDYGPIGDLMADPDPDESDLQAVVSDLDSHYAPGVYMVLTTSPRPRSFQIGFDETAMCDLVDEVIANLGSLEDHLPGYQSPYDVSLLELFRCPEDPLEYAFANFEWGYRAQDPLMDIQDLELSGSRMAAAQASEILMTEAAVTGDHTFEASLYVSLASTKQQAAAIIENARAQGATDLLDETADYWRERMAEAFIPSSIDERRKRFCQRTLTNLLVGMDRDTNAIVASISRQPPYGLDWPRDGAFFNMALDIAGFTDIVTKRMEFYTAIQRKEDEPPVLFINAPAPEDPDDPESGMYPAGGWEMNYYANGKTGGTIRFEIDNAALMLWSFGVHAAFIEDEDERMSYLESIYPSMKLGADLIARWKDPETGLQAPANEDDNPSYTAGLHGAVTVHLGLMTSARVAKMLGRGEDMDRWHARAREIKEAILEHLFDDDHVLFKSNISQGSVPPGLGASSWLVWPVILLPPTDPRIINQVHTNMETAVAVLNGEGSGGSYLTKAMIAAAYTTGRNPQLDIVRDLLAEAVDLHFERLVDPSTDYLGEAFVNIGGTEGGDPVFENRVAQPHLWSATLLYITVVMQSSPGVLDRIDEVLPRIDEEIDVSGSGTGCSIAMAR